MIYIISDGIHIKVGKSKHPKKRLKELQTGSSKALSLIRVYDKPDYFEKRIHRILRSFNYRFKSEWFYCGNEQKLLSVIEKIVNG